MKTNKIVALISLFLLAVMLTSLVSCAVNVKAEDLSAGYSRKSTSQGEVNDEFKSAMVDFAFKLFKATITKDNENDLVSPLSAINALAMVANGAEGETKTQIEAAFGMDIESLNKSLYAYTTSLYSSNDCKLKLANSIWFRNNGLIQLKENFLQANADWYNTKVFAAPFDASTLKAINNWCKDHTDGMIKNIIEKINPDDIIYIINALVFDAKWNGEYKANKIKSEKFNNYNGKKTSVEMLNSNEKAFLKGDGFKGFAKNYTNNKYSFVALLPDESIDIYDFIDTLSGEKWLSIWNNQTIESIDVKLPEFTYEVQMDLNQPLINMGMTDMFLPNANFSKLSENALYCSKVFQKTYIEVNRKGTKAAAATIISYSMGSAVVGYTQTVYLDRPFVYALVDNATGLPFFIGAVTNLK